MRKQEKERQEYIKKIKKTPLSELAKTLSKKDYEEAIQIHKDEQDIEKVNIRARQQEQLRREKQEN